MSRKSPQKVVSLTVHRNTRDKRERRRVRDSLVSNVRSSVRELGGDVAGYALVVWDADRQSVAHWDSGETMPGDCVGEYAKRIIERTVTKVYDT